VKRERRNGENKVKGERKKRKKETEKRGRRE
jgi:hypothetical protein